MLRLTNVFYLLLVIVRASEADLLGDLQESFGHAMKHSRYDVKTYYQDVDKYLSRSILEMQFKRPYRPIYSNSDGLSSTTGSIFLESPTAECYEFLRHESRRNKVIECSTQHLKDAQHRRKHLRTIYNNTLVRLETLANATKDCDKTESNNIIPHDLMASQCVIKAAKELDSIVQETKLQFTQIDKQVTESVLDWVVLSGRCTVSGDDPSSLMDWFESCKSNIRRLPHLSERGLPIA